MKRGFTLIELLVVVLIIGILSSVALPQYQKSVDRTKGVEALTVAKAIADAENVYFMSNGFYDPSIENEDFSALDIEIANLENWDIGTSGSGCHSSTCFFYIKGDGTKVVFDTGSSTIDYAVSVKYHLENGKKISRTCVGEKCQNYFGVKSGEEF